MSKSSEEEETLLFRLVQMSKVVDAPCPIGRIHKMLDVPTAKALLEALQSPASNSAIHQALIDEGFSIARNTINQKRECFREGTDNKCLCLPNNLGVINE